MNEDEKQTDQEHTQSIPWMDRFDKMNRRIPRTSTSSPDCMNWKVGDSVFEQLTLFPEDAPTDDRSPITTMWNLWHGCTKVSAGCQHCYMYRRDEAVGRDPSVVEKTSSFNLPITHLRSGIHKGLYKVPSGSHLFTCFSSDFFHKDADDWRSDAWNMMRERSDCSFFMIIKRPERVADHLPSDWKIGWDHVTIAVTCENQEMADKRLPIYLDLPLLHREIMIEPMLTAVDMSAYLSNNAIESVSVGGESGPDARPCDFDWVVDVQRQCVEHGVHFHYHQTGARLIRDGKEYRIPRELQHTQARATGLDC